MDAGYLVCGDAVLYCTAPVGAVVDRVCTFYSSTPMIGFTWLCQGCVETLKTRLNPLEHNIRVLNGRSILRCRNGISELRKSQLGHERQEYKGSMDVLHFGTETSLL
jgi:hypothetical protein